LFTPLCLCHQAV